MKDGKYEMKDLSGKDCFVALSTLLVAKGIILEDELYSALEKELEAKNKGLEKQLEENPGFKFILDMMKPMGK